MDKMYDSYDKTDFVQYCCHVCGVTNRRRGPRKDKRQRLAKPVHPVRAEINQAGPLQGTDSPTEGQNEDDNMTTGRRSARKTSTRTSSRSDRKGRASERHATETGIAGNNFTLLTNETTTEPDDGGTMKNGEKYQNDLATTAKTSSDALQRSLDLLDTTPNSSRKTNVQEDIENHAQLNDEIPRDDNAREVETRKRDELLLTTVTQQENSILGDSGAKDNAPLSTPESSDSRNNDRVWRAMEGHVSDKTNVWTENDGLWAESEATERYKNRAVVNSEPLNRHTGSTVESEISDGQTGNTVESVISDGQTGNMVESEISVGQTRNMVESVISDEHTGIAYGQTGNTVESQISYGHTEHNEKVVNSGTSDRHAREESEAPGSAPKVSEAIAEGGKLNDKDTKVDDFPYVYEDDFSDEEEDNTEAVDFFRKIAQS